MSTFHFARGTDSPVCLDEAPDTRFLQSAISFEFRVVRSRDYQSKWRLERAAFTCCVSRAESIGSTLCFLDVLKSFPMSVPRYHTPQTDQKSCRQSAATSLARCSSALTFFSNYFPRILSSFLFISFLLFSFFLSSQTICVS